MWLQIKGTFLALRAIVKSVDQTVSNINTYNPYENPCALQINRCLLVSVSPALFSFAELTFH